MIKWTIESTKVRKRNNILSNDKLYEHWLCWLKPFLREAVWDSGHTVEENSILFEKKQRMLVARKWLIQRDMGRISVKNTQTVAVIYKEFINVNWPTDNSSWCTSCCSIRRLELIVSYFHACGPDESHSRYSSQRRETGFIAMENSRTFVL